MISLDSKQLSEKPKKVGVLDSKPVYAVRTKGGLNMICSSTGKPLGVGPHQAVARAIAAKAEPALVWNDLAKGDWIDPSHYQFLLPRYEALTTRLQALQEK